MGIMKTRNALLIGFAAGYVLGRKAGRERYEQIRKIASVVANNPPVKQFLDESRDLAEMGTAKAREALGDQLREASQQIRDKIR